MGKGEILLMGRNRITLSLRFSKIIYVICLCLCVSVYSESSKQNHINKCSNKSYNKQTEDIIDITNKQVNKCGVSMTWTTRENVMPITYKKQYRKVIYLHANAELEKTWLISIDQGRKDYRVTVKNLRLFSGMVKYYKIH